MGGAHLVSERRARSIEGPRLVSEIGSMCKRCMTADALRYVFAPNKCLTEGHPRTKRPGFEFLPRRVKTKILLL